MIATHDPNVPVLIASALQKCRTNCTDLEVATVMQDPKLEHDVLILYELDRWTRRRRRVEDRQADGATVSVDTALPKPQH